jgi:hypothetical protein
MSGDEGTAAVRHDGRECTAHARIDAHRSSPLLSSLSARVPRASIEVVSEFALVKLVELWNHPSPEGLLYYAFRPPWVRRRADESFFVLHPELATMGGKLLLPPEKKELMPGGAGGGDQQQEEQLRLTAGGGGSTTARNQPQQPQQQQYNGAALINA